MVAYHVTLNSQGYVLDLDRYARRVREPFAPKQSVGSVAVEDLRGPEQVQSISDWSGGDGYVQHEDGRYRSGAGVDGYSVPGSLRLGPHVSTVGTTAVNEVRSLCAYLTKLYAGCSAGKIHSWDGASFANPQTVTGTPTVAALKPPQDLSAEVQAVSDVAPVLAGRIDRPHGRVDPTVGNRNAARLRLTPPIPSCTNSQQRLPLLAPSQRGGGGDPGDARAPR